MRAYWPALVSFALSALGSSQARACEINGTAISPLLVHVDVNEHKFEPYVANNVAASATLGPDVVRIHIRSPIDFSGWSRLSDVSAFTRRRVTLGDGMVELPPNTELRAHSRDGRIVFDLWLGSLSVVDLSAPCDALTLDRVGVDDHPPPLDEKQLERRSLVLGIVELSPAPGASGTVRVRVDGNDSSVGVLERRGPWRRIRMASSGARIVGWVDLSKLGPAQREPFAHARGSGGVTCFRPPLTSSSVVRAGIDPGTVVRIGSPSGQVFGTVVAGELFEVEADSSEGGVKIHSAPHLEGGCVPEALDHRLDSLFVPKEAVHAQPQLSARQRAEWFLMALRGVTSISNVYDAARGHTYWRAVGKDTVVCNTMNEATDGYQCQRLIDGHLSPTVPPAWAKRLGSWEQDPPYAVGGLPAFGLDSNTVHLALRAANGEWLLTPPLAADGAAFTPLQSRIGSVQTLAQSSDGSERLARVQITTHAGTRWSIEQYRLFYFRIDGDTVRLDSLPLGYSEAFNHNDVFRAAKGQVSQLNKAKPESPRSVVVTPLSQDRRQLGLFCTTGAESAETDTCNSASLNAVGEAVGRWSIKDDHFVRRAERLR